MKIRIRLGGGWWELGLGLFVEVLMLVMYCWGGINWLKWYLIN